MAPLPSRRTIEFLRRTGAGSSRIRGFLPHWAPSRRGGTALAAGLWVAISAGPSRGQAAPLAGPGDATASPPPTTGFSVFLGGAWHEPGGDPFADVYDGGVGVSGGFGHEWAQGARVELRIARFASEAPLSSSPLFEHPRGDVQVVPILLEAQLRLARLDRRLWIGAGGGLWIHRERIRYALASERREIESTRTDPAISAMVAWEQPAAKLRLRFSGRYECSFAEERVLRGAAEIDGDSIRPSWVSGGVELIW